MRLLSVALFFLAAKSVLLAQTMLPAAEWCASGKKFAAAAVSWTGGGPDQRSDSFDIRKTTLRLSIPDFTVQQISGSATLELESRLAGVDRLRLDLLGLSIDSIVPLSAADWSYNGQEIRIQLDSPLDAGQSLTLDIYYHGKPLQDASGWGGFYWQGSYAYNLGVGFAADPHSFGRAWFPCFDNFVERSSFEFFITTPADRPAYCNGVLAGQETLPGNLVRRHWVLDQAIPSYLACVAAGPFASYRRNLAGETGPVPVEIAVAPADSNKLKASFLHLPEALSAFEHWYGPYRWGKIGYSVVPFNSGAMEHATNIAYMRQAVDGTTASETLFAHELSHHWWGDLATCSSAEDMWLNEGWAVYSEHLFLEKVYGPERFREAVESNFLNVLERAHVNEDGYRAVSGLPHEYTYGQHVYNKGAVVAHNLRGYLGDTAFRDGIRTALDKNQFDDWSSAGFRDRLSAASGQDLTDFFNDWVFNPGFTHFSIDSTKVFYSPVDAPTLLQVFVKQKLRGTAHLYQKVPLEFTFVNSQGQREYRTALVSGENTVLEFSFPSFAPAPIRVWVNTRQHLTLARAEKELVAKSLTSYNFSPAKLSIKLNSLQGDSVLLRAEHHYVRPDTGSFANPNGFLLTNRYWSIDALPGASFDADATFYYDGKGDADQLDTELFAQTGPSEDSMLLLYRPGAGFPWQPFPSVQKSTLGSAVDRFGLLRALHVLPGQYTIAKGVATVSTGSPGSEALTVSLSPNPARHRVRIKANAAFDRVQVFSLQGDLVQETSLPGSTEAEISTASWAPGTYWLMLSGKGHSGIAGPLNVVR